MKILYVWTGITPCVGDCWRRLAAQPGVELQVVVDAQRDPKREREVLYDLDYVIAEGKPLGSEFAPGFRPDVVFALGWHSKVVRAFVERADWKDIPKVCCFDLPWRWKLRCFAARFVLHRYLKRFQAAFVPGVACERYAKWLGFPHIAKGSLCIDVERFGEGDVTTTRKRSGFLYVGRQAPEKRLDLIEKAYARYRELGGSWSLDRHHTTPYPQLPQVYAQHACLVLFSEHDAWPLAALEAKAAGCEVILSDRCGNRFELQARVVRFGDVEALAREMLKVERDGTCRRDPSVTEWCCDAWVRRILEMANALQTKK